MRLIVPWVREPADDDLRLMRLAEFAGVECRGIEVNTAEAIAGRAGPGRGDCLAMNARTFSTLLGGEVPEGLGADVASRFPRVLLHGVRPGEFDDSLVRVLTAGQIRLAGEAEAGAQYCGAGAPACGAFAGRTFGLAKRPGDCIFSFHSAADEVQTLATLGARPLVVSSQQHGNQVVCVGSRELADLEETVGDRPSAKWFGRLLPPLIALRHIFGEACWHGAEPPRAALIIDDPLLRPRYGCLNFERLAEWQTSRNFATTIAFIPYNFRRSADRTVRLFRGDPGRLGICFHGNDHTGNEMASKDRRWLNTALGAAEARMAEHQAVTGIPCPKVVVFPQEHFSVEAMEVLQARNFWAAVKDGASPVGQRRELTIRELAQPAFLGFGGFPLFQRRYVTEATCEEMAFNVFFGRPILLCEHHAIFRNPERLFGVVDQANAIARDLVWGGAEQAVLNATLSLRDEEGGYHVRAYSSTVRVLNETGHSAPYSVEWPAGAGSGLFEGATCAGSGEYAVEVRGSSVRLRMHLAAGEARVCSLHYRDEMGSAPPPSARWRAKVAVRRRLSEARDNYASSSRLGKAVAKALRDRLVARGL